MTWLTTARSRALTPKAPPSSERRRIAHPSAMLAFALALTVSKSAFALGVSQCDFSNVDDLVLNGFADQSGGFLELTDGDFSEWVSVYYGSSIPWTGATSFHTTFQFQI